MYVCARHNETMKYQVLLFIQYPSVIIFNADQWPPLDNINYTNNLNILSVPKFSANPYCICLSIDLRYT